ncbi:hypothetical protein EOS_31575 [Caballeronia mineralivorans PML1(12)]|uniref:Uncharacterized protein n=1 Tax=Caballeronia mineralivorans PML1(12) TaxID=908627 RepID=A0A0J1FR59_9BURK|nr:hypothetical protein [Caballeronia mineralivorans]KLU22238.1 hypothetical protein EOS_31575 [Caballeronia mineralivorans PML1(12)]
MNLTKVKTAIRELEQNEQAIAKTKADIGRIQNSLEAARSHAERVQELQTRRSDALADALIDSRQPDVSKIDDELRQLERSSKAEFKDLDVPTAALAKLNQRLLDLEAAEAALRMGKDQACREVINVEIGEIEQEIDKCIATLNGHVLRCVAFTKVKRQFVSDNRDNRHAIDGFLVGARLDASVRKSSVPAEFTYPLAGNKTVQAHCESLTEEFEKVGAIKRRS